jgi:hypothetical protein
MAVAQPKFSRTAANTPSNRLLLEKLSKIPGVRASTYASRLFGNLVFEVKVDERNIDAEMAVYQAELQVYQQFEDERFELYVV